MASQSAIAEGSSTVTADQINYQQKLFSHPSYVLDPQFPNTFGQPINLSTSSQIPVTINIPPEVFNLSQSYLQYTVVIPQGQANTYTWYALQALREISHIQYYSSNNQWCVDIDQLQNYLDITLKKELSQDEFLSLDPMTGVSQSNSVVNVVPALRNTNVLVANTPNLPANPSSLNYLEPGYFQVASAISGAGVAGQVTYNVQFPLRLIKNSLFSVDKDLYFGATTYMRLYFGPMSKIAFSNTVNDSPSNGTKTSYVPLAAATNTPSITGLQLMLARESNQDLRTMIINKVSGGGLTYMIPYVQSFKNSNQGTSQNISIQLDQGNGRTLMKVYHAPYNSTEDLDTMYDHANTANVAGANFGSSATNQKIFTYYTTLNSKRIQDLTLDCTNNGPFTDYMSHRRQLRGSILANLNVYQYNWFHCDDWSDFGPRYDQDNKGELISGVPMNVAPLTWAFQALTTRNIILQHYTWFVFIKKLSIAPGQVIVD
jgi:hypothetical protein